MSRADIVKMEAGRELDAVVATTLFGFQWLPWAGNREQKVLVRSPQQAESNEWWGKDVMWLVACFSRSLEASRFVINEMRQRGWTFRLVAFPTGGYSAWFEKHLQPIQSPDRELFDQIHNAEAETEPLAICRAALIAIVESEKQ